MKKIILVIPILMVMLASLSANAQIANQSNANIPLLTSGNQSNVSTPLLNTVPVAINTLTLTIPIVENPNTVSLAKMFSDAIGGVGLRVFDSGQFTLGAGLIAETEAPDEPNFPNESDEDKVKAGKKLASKQAAANAFGNSEFVILGPWSTITNPIK
jgi:hypothetical protein